MLEEILTDLAVRAIVAVLHFLCRRLPQQPQRRESPTPQRRVRAIAIPRTIW